MGICDDLDGWDDPESDSSTRFDAVRDWIRSEAESWGMDPPEVKLGESVDADGNHHWSSYNRDTDTITMDPAMFDDPKAYPAEDVYNSAAHEMRHAMQDQYGDGEDAAGEDDGGAADRQDDAKDFAAAYQEMWDSECGGDDADSSPGSDDLGVGDWNLPAGGTGYG